LPFYFYGEQHEPRNAKNNKNTNADIRQRFASRDDHGAAQRWQHCCALFDISLTTEEDNMTGFKSKKAAALDEDGMYLVHHTKRKDDDDDDTQVYKDHGDALTIAYQSGYYDGKKAALAGRERNFCSRCGKRTADLTTIHTCTPPQKNT
jgi:hypothetical protein